MASSIAYGWIGTTTMTVTDSRKMAGGCTPVKRLTETCNHDLQPPLILDIHVIVNRPFARPGHMVQNYIYWWANCTLGLSKQCTCLCFGSPTHNFLTSIFNFVPGRAKGLLTPVKTRYLLTSIPWSYCRLRSRAYWGDMVFKLTTDQVLDFGLDYELKLPGCYFEGESTCKGKISVQLKSWHVADIFLALASLVRSRIYCMHNFNNLGYND